MSAVFRASDDISGVGAAGVGAGVWRVCGLEEWDGGVDGRWVGWAGEMVVGAFRWVVVVVVAREVEGD